MRFTKLVLILKNKVFGAEAIHPFTSPLASAPNEKILFCSIMIEAPRARKMKKRKVYVPTLRSHALRYRFVSFGSDNTVYEVRSCRRSPIFFLPTVEKTSHIPIRTSVASNLR